ncbi:MAG: hypothetical protein Phog2KO_18210 [Phototrophicaceae bacterium]
MDELSKEILKGWHVLAVDDDPKSLDIVTTLLRLYGANVYSAQNGKEGILMAREHQPDLIITDLSMPEIDGWALIQTLKQDRVTLEIPIIALTAHAMRGDRTRAIAAGCHNHLQKPLTPYTFIKDLLSLLLDIPEFEARLQNSNIYKSHS